MNAIIEACLLHARYHGLLPSHVDVQATGKVLAPMADVWTAPERVAAEAWCGRCSLPGTDPAPGHVVALVQQAKRLEVV